MLKKVLFTLISVIGVVLFWYYLGAVNILKDNSNSFSKLQCVSYAPYSKDDSPFNPDYVITEELVSKDLKLLSKYTDCIRTYSTVGLEMVPKIARENNLKMLMGAWVSSNKKSTKKELDTLIKLANENQDIVKAVIVGNEVLLRHDTSDKQLFEYIKYVKSALPNTQVTYADVWEYWLKYPIIQEATDFVTIHILPYWEDEPMGIKKAISHLGKVREEVEGILNDKNILIGETGWPSEGRMREDAHPSKINQAIFIREFVKLAEEKNWDYNIIEAFDQPWKRISEGAVGGFWGLFDKDRNDKNVFAGDVSDFPNYQYLAVGSVFLVLLFSLLLKNSEISTKRLLAFTIVNMLFALLYTLQVEQYNITVRTNIEMIWAGLVLITHILIYYFLLLNIVKKENAELFPTPLFYASAFFVSVITIILAFEGRYENFQIYAFSISALSFFWVYNQKLLELDSGRFEKILSLILFVSLIFVIKSETIVNIFSNIWVLIALVFTYILYSSSSHISFSKILKPLLFILVFIAVILGFKFGIITNKEYITQCNLTPDLLVCKIRNIFGYMFYFGYIGFTAAFFTLLAFVLNNKVISYIALFLSIAAVLLYNIFTGSIVFVIALLLIFRKCK